MVAVLSVCEIIVAKVGPSKSISSVYLEGKNAVGQLAYPDMIISSSIPYSFMCCRPHPSLMRFGTYFLRSPVRFGVWYMRISTLSGPNSSIKGASRDAEHAEGVSRVPRRASVSTLSFNSGFARRASPRTDIYSFSVNSAQT